MQKSMSHLLSVAAGVLLTQSEKLHIKSSRRLRARAERQTTV